VSILTVEVTSPGGRLSRAVPAVAIAKCWMPFVLRLRVDDVKAASSWTCEDCPLRKVQ
jgi:hypothetical protein